MNFPARIVGGFRSGKTTRLKQLAEALPQPLVICATEDAAAAFDADLPAGAAKTFWRLAAEIVERHDRPVRILSSAEQEARVGDRWLARAVCHYQASFLGREELRTHADAAGVYDQWEAVADAAEDYLPRGECDWAGVLVRASLLLRDESVLEAERARFSHVLVDDFEAASFATNRLLSQLAGFGGPVVVAGNPAADVWRHLGGSARYLDRFPRRLGAVHDEVLDRTYPGGGVGHAGLLLAHAGDPWLPHADEPIPVPLAASRAWESVTLYGQTDGDVLDDSPYDLDVLAGPDVPDDDARAQRQRRENAALLAMAESRACPPS